MSSWAVAAILAAIGLATLFLIGVLTGPEEPSAPSVALETKAASPSHSAPSHSAAPKVAVESPAPSPSASAAVDDGSIALDNGIDVVITAATARCWVEVQSDGAPAYRGTLEVGDSQTIHADNEMSIVLGYAAGVELEVNGQPLGAPGGPGVETIHLPQDIKSLVRG
jgi:hypothetical protein